MLIRTTIIASFLAGVLCVLTQASAQTDPTPAEIEAKLGQVQTLTQAKKYTEALTIIKELTRYSAQAQVFMGIYLDKGYIGTRDPTQALEWYRSAANAGNVHAYFYLGRHFEKGEGVKADPVSARAFYKICADAGDVYCQNNFGITLLFGIGGPVDKDGAVKYFSAAASKGQVNSLTSLADCYESGSGVQIDLGRAFFYYTEAAKKGFHIAHGSLGHLYEKGLGVPKNDVYAAMHYILATQQLIGEDGDYHRQRYHEYSALLERMKATLSDGQFKRAGGLARRWPNVPVAAAEVGMGSTTLAVLIHPAEESGWRE
jgi:TPR repeat protein